MKRILALAVMAALITAPVSAVSDDPAIVVSDITADVVAQITAMSEAASESGTSIWQLPYDVLSEIDLTLDAGLQKVDGLTVPECLEDWKDAVRVALILLDDLFETVGRAAGQPDTKDQELLSAYSGGYPLLVTVAPLMLSTADCTLGEGEA